MQLLLCLGRNFYNKSPTSKLILSDHSSKSWIESKIILDIRFKDFERTMKEKNTFAKISTKITILLRFNGVHISESYNLNKEVSQP